MVYSCCIKRCKTEWNPQTDISFFSFPLRNIKLLREWMQHLSIGTKITKYSRICSKHFTDSSFIIVGGKRALKKDAIPTIFEHDVLEDHRYTNNKEQITAPPTGYIYPLIQLSNDCHVEETSFLCPIVDIQGPETSIHHEEVIQPSEDNSFLEDQPLCGITETQIPQFSLYHEEITQKKDVATEISPHLLAPSEEEKKLRAKVKSLQNQLRQKEKMILKDLKRCYELLHLNHKTEDVIEQVQQVEVLDAGSDVDEAIADEHQNETEEIEWPHEATLLLLEEYREREDDFETGQISEENMWRDISNRLFVNGYDVTVPQCITKFYDMKQMYEEERENDFRNSSIEPYLSVMDEIFKEKPAMSPESDSSSTRKRARLSSECSSVDTSSEQQNPDHTYMKKKSQQ
ncbi:uncharacterized protein [Venturia canescens]|uniref:uncharacterized protein n=1 Tax=Venturia canescens TaxID=32260 RepID=UPI001C9C4C98|nr:uncharacterized protein LOC122416346 [Venturia canescens]